MVRWAIPDSSSWGSSFVLSLTGGGSARPVWPAPEAQGPAPDAGDAGDAHDAQGRLRTGGPFRWSRHPLNFVPLPIILFAPTMTLKRAAFAAASAAYLVLGSLHEELRLRRAYGDRYLRYQRSGVPFYLPGLRARRH